jgi:hypothetical protein
MIYRQYHPDLIEVEEELRNNLLSVLFNFEIPKAHELLSKESKLSALTGKMLEDVNGSSDELHFKNIKSIAETIMHLLRWVSKSLNAEGDAEAQLKAGKLKVDLIDLNSYNYFPAFREGITRFVEGVKALKEPGEVKSLFDDLFITPFPYLFAIEVDPYSQLRKSAPIEQPEDDKESLVVAVEFFLDEEPWANPQMLKPATIYRIKGKISLNKWPEGFEKLILKPVSTYELSLYDLIIPEIAKFDDAFIEISGQIVFKYPQHSFDESFVVKLFACFVNPSGGIIIPALIGYNQLIAKVLDPNSFFFLVGFKGMHPTILDIYLTLTKDMPTLDEEERTDFLKLLQGILNFQGYALQEGIYKYVADLAENDFRDQLIQHLKGLPYLGDAIIKEAHLSGGRVEIGYNGIIAELKVEKTISDRDKLITKYGKQPVAYSSGNAQQLSILCVLDLTEKILPPAPPQNNVRLITPAVHGFSGSNLPFAPKQAFIVLDGNTKNPSDYSA